MDYLRYFRLPCLMPLVFLFGINLAHGQDPLPSTKDTALYFSSKIMGETRTLWVHLPADYHTTTKSYPVLYMLDGDSQFFQGASAADFLAGYDRNRIPQMIAVGIVNVDRGRDFQPVLMKGATGNFDRSKVSLDSGAGRFLRYLESEVVPYIDGHYRVQPYRVLVAHSLGGGFALYAKEARPKLFPGLILTSPVITDELVAKLDGMLTASALKNGKLFVGIGNENTAKVDALVAALERQPQGSIDWSSEKYPQENHFSAPYKTVFDGLKFIYRNWFIDYYSDQSLSIADIDAHFARLSAGFGYLLVPDEEFLNNCGYSQLRRKHTANAVGIFLANVKRFPESFNAYDSLAEAYMTAGNRELAIKYYKKSLELNPANNSGRAALERLEKTRP